MIIDNLDFENKNSYMVISIKNKMDSTNAQEIGKIIEERISRFNGDIILNFENLEYMTSAGLQTILIIAKNRKSINKTLSIYKPQKAVDYVLQVSGFYSFLDKAESL